MIITKQQVAIQVLNYLQHKISLSDLVAWAEDAIMEGKIQEDDHLMVRDILGKLGLADVKAFGLYWDDCEEIMKKLGYVLKINAGLVA